MQNQVFCDFYNPKILIILPFCASLGYIWLNFVVSQYFLDKKTTNYLWLESPLGKLVCFMYKQNGYYGRFPQE